MNRNKYTIYNINEKGRVTISSLFCSWSDLWLRMQELATEGSSTTVFCNGSEVLQIG